ncbi:MAG: multiheme c-type cytochrome [Thiovulaceae bacterium]|nr:multiheme c-type cytochrome [Sulfurimonadaceae bacterium]
MKNSTLYMKLSIFLMFSSGIFQMSYFDVSWGYFRMIQAIHILSSIFVAVFILIPYVNKHTYKYMVIRKVNSISGVVLGIVLFLLILSGAYLFLLGNRGGDEIGIAAFNIHLYGSFILLAALLWHIKEKAPNIVAALFVILFIQSPSYSEEIKLHNIQIKEGFKRYHNQDWTNSAKCKSCHEDIFNQWADSNHRHMAGTNPYYMVMENLAAEDMGQEFRLWCMGCHNPSAVTTDKIRTAHAMDGNNMPGIIFESGSKDLINELKVHGNNRLEEGVSCVACHRILKTESKGNSSYTLDLTSREKYVFEDNTNGIRHWLGEKFINSNPKVHKNSYMKDIYKESSYCASCHDEFLPDSKKAVVSTFKEWEKSPFNNPNDKSKHKTCIDCHMTKLQNGKLTPLKGTSTDGGTIKDDVKVHYFSGSNHFLSGMKSKEHEDQTIQLLKTAAELDVDIRENKIFVGVKNIGAGHHLPTGVSDFRELWLDVTLYDENSNVVYSSGKLKEDGNLDSDARVFMKVFGDKDLKPVGLFFWRYEKMISDTRIPAGERRVEVFDIKNLKDVKLSKIIVKLNFRIYPQWVTDIVKNAYPQLTNPPVVELERIEKDFR